MIRLRHGSLALLVPRHANAAVLAVFAFVFTFGQVPSIFGQSVFPLPGWFKANVKRPKTLDQEKVASDYLSSLMKDGKLGLIELP